MFSEFKGDDLTPYPFEVSVPILVEQIKQYIENCSQEDIIRLAGEEPDNDGIVNLGWEVFCPLWYDHDKIVNYDFSMILAVRPC